VFHIDNHQLVMMSVSLEQSPPSPLLWAKNEYSYFNFPFLLALLRRNDPNLAT